MRTSNQTKEGWGKAEWGYAGIIFSYGDFFSNAFCVCGLPFYDVFFFYRKA